MKYNEIEDRYYNLDDILKLNIPDLLKQEYKEKFKKRVFYDSNGSCKVGTLVGLAKNYKLSDYFYIIEIKENKSFVPIWKSITIL